MAQRHELEIEIAPDGKIQVTVHGAKGKRCMEYVELFQTLGRVTDEQKTSEYYEPDGTVSITDSTKTRIVPE